MYAHRNGCPWDKRTCEEAAENGHLEVLQYAHSRKCPWDETTCAGAVAGGHLECLRYARRNGCPWDEPTKALAADTLQYTEAYDPDPQEEDQDGFDCCFGGLWGFSQWKQKLLLPWDDAKP